MTKQEMQKRIKELYKAKGNTISERIKINRELVHLEIELEKIINK